MNEELEDASETRGDRPHGGHDPRNATVSVASRRQSASDAEKTRDEEEGNAQEDDIDAAQAHRTSKDRLQTGRETCERKRRRETSHGAASQNEAQALKPYTYPGYATES